MREKYVFRHYSALSDLTKKAHTGENFDIMTSLTKTETPSIYGEKLLTNRRFTYVTKNICVALLS